MDEIREEMGELVSIIIPVYNVELYLERCLDSLLKQKYKNIQIILVDDGSCDTSGKICDAYAEKDSRVEVYHKVNGGVSSARNIGLSKVKGNYIGFVDSDDYLDEGYLQKLVDAIAFSDADIAVCNYYIVKNDEQRCGKIKSNEMCQEDAMHMLMADENMPSYLWNKLFRAKLFDGIQFPEGYLYEDLRIMHKLFMSAHKIVSISNPLYFYCYREKSITASTRFNQSKELIEGWEVRCEELDGSVYYWEARQTEMMTIRRILLEILLYRVNKDQFYDDMVSELKRLYKECRTKLKFGQKIKYLVFFFSPEFYAKWLYSRRME